MLNKFVDVLIRKYEIKNITSSNTVYSKFFYPKLAIVIGRFVKVIDLDCNNDDLCSTDHCLDTDEDIVDVFLEEHFLWLILGSGQLLLYDLINNLQLHVEYKDSNNCLLKQFKTDGIDFYIINDNGHCMKVLNKASNLFGKYTADKEIVCMELEKTRPSKSLYCQKKYYDIMKCEENISGLQLEIDRGALIIKCPLTGLRAVVGAGSMDYKDVVPWCDMAVICKDNGITIVNLYDSKIQLDLNSDDDTFYTPLIAWKNHLYYLLSNNNEVYVHLVNKTTSEEEKSFLSNVTTVSNIQNLTNQTTLKEQLQQIIHSVLSNRLYLSDICAELQIIFNDIDDVTYLVTKGIELCKHDFKYKCVLESLYVRSKTDITILNKIGITFSKMDIIEYISVLNNDRYNKNDILDGNLVDICISFINNGDLDLASMAWVKLQRFCNVTEDNIITILNATPNNIKMNSFVLWLKNFIPSILEENPFYVDLFVKWTTDRIFSFEKSPYWPKMGIKFLEEILLVLQLSQSNLITIRPTSMDHIDTLIVNITKIYKLKETYKINMLLEEFSSLSSPEVALIMLQRCYTEDLESFLHNYLTSFATENSLDLDNILHTYIERETLESGGGADEPRLRILLNAFYTNNTKLQCLLDVIRTLDVPWPPPMHELAIFCVTLHEAEFTMCDEGLKLIHDIKMEINFANLKVVLKKYNFPLTTTDYLLVLHNIVNAAVVDIYDLKIIIQSLSGYANYGNILYINRCLRDCFVKKSLNYFKSLPMIDQKIVIKAIVIKYEFIINDSTSNPLVERSYLDFIKGTHVIDFVKLSKIEAMYHLKNSYNIKTNLNEMSRETQRNGKISEWFLHNNESASSGRGACVSKLARLPQTFMSTVVELLSQTSGNVKINSLIESFVVIFNSINITSYDIETQISHFRDTKNGETLLNCCQVLVQLIHYCPEEYLHLLVAVLTLLSAIMNTSNIVKHLTIAWKLHYVFVPMSNISSTDNLITSLVNIYSKQTMNENFIKNIYIKNDFVPFRILSTCAYRHITLGSNPGAEYFENKENIAKQMVSNISLSQECDELFLASALLLLNAFKDNADKQKANILWQLLEEYGEATPISKYVAAPMMLRALGLSNYSLTDAPTTAPYNILKTKYNLDLADLALPDITEDTWDAKIVLYYVLKNYPDTSLQKLQSYCQTLNIDIDDGLSLQLISQIVSWELKYIIGPDDWKCLQMYYENDENDLYAKCIIFWNSIKKKSFIIDVLRDFWKKGEVSLQGRLVSINPYYYEIYLCIFKIIDKHADWLNINEYFLLNFLKEYRRTSKPKQYEFELFSIKGMFPEIGHYRLPFQLFMREDMWSNLKSEITLATYEKWLPIVSYLNLDSDLQIACDMLCSNALKQTMTSRKRNNEINCSNKHIEIWRLEAKEEQLLRAAHRCVRHISNMEWAAACLFYVLQGCARGADQVAAAQLCYHFAQRWAAVQPANRAVRQMEKLHGTLSTRHALHKIDWACEDLLRFIAEPNQLVRAIYFHTDFVSKMTRYNVNKTVDEIADKNNLNIGSIRIQILENILEQNSEDKRDKIGLNNDDLMRAKHILKATCPKMGAMYLARIALEDETDFNKIKKLRAFQCLISVVEPDTSLKVTNMERQSLWHGLIDLFFIIRLEQVDMPWAIATFSKDKLRTLEQVCCASENNTEALQLAAELTVRYGCEENTRNLIPRLVSTGLNDILNTLLCKTLIYPDNLISSAWKAVITSPFVHADYPITDRQRHICIKVINTLPLCSCLTDEDLNIIWKNCIRIKCYSIACLVLPFMSASAQQSLFELKKIDKRNLIAGLKNLQTESYLINGALSVIENMTSRKIR